MYGQAAIKEPLCWLNRNKAFSVRETAWPPRRTNGVTHFTPPLHRGMHRGRMEQWPTPGTCGSHSAATRRWLCPRLPSLAGPTSEPRGLVESRAYQRPVPAEQAVQKIITNACDPPARAPDKGFSSSCLSTQLLFYIFWNALFIFALVSSSEIRLILQGRRSRGVIFGLGKIRNHVDGFSSVQAHTAAANFRIQPNTLFHRIRSGSQLGPVKHSKKKCNCKWLSQWLQCMFQLQGGNERGLKRRIFEKSQRKIVLSKTWKSHS